MDEEDGCADGPGHEQGEGSRARGKQQDHPPPGSRSFSPGALLTRLHWISIRVLVKLRFCTFGISVASER